MRHITKLALAASAMTMISVSVAAAADPIIMPEPVPEPPVSAGGWYLRGDISYDFETKGTIFVSTSSSSTSFVDMDSPVNVDVVTKFCLAV